MKPDTLKRRRHAQMRKRMSLGDRPELMTGRARLYLLCTTVMHGAIAYFCLFRPDRFQSPSYRDIERSVWGGFTTWGVLFSLAAVLTGWSACRRRMILARIGLILSAAIEGAWAGGFLAAAIFGQTTGPSGPVVWAALTVKDLLQCRSPLRVPLEPVVREVLSDEES